jgi:hypothetical protein
MTARDQNQHAVRIADLAKQSMSDLRDEERYWEQLVQRAQERGQDGRSFLRCLGSVRAEIEYREQRCPCGQHQHHDDAGAIDRNQRAAAMVEQHVQEGS